MRLLTFWSQRGAYLRGALIRGITVGNKSVIQGGQKKKRTGNFLQNSQNIGPMNLKIGMHNLNTHSFQNLKYEITNSKAT